MDTPILDQLRTLSRLFPNATELAVTADQHAEYEAQVAMAMRFYELVPLMRWYPEEELPGGLYARRTALRYRNATLTITWTE